MTEIMQTPNPTCCSCKIIFKPNLKSEYFIRNMCTCATAGPECKYSIVNMRSCVSANAKYLYFIRNV